MPEGFIHNGRRVFSLLYRLESPPPTSMELVVPLDSEGNAIGPTKPGDKSKRMVNVKPGDTLLYQGQPYRVLAVETFRSLPGSRPISAERHLARDGSTVNIFDHSPPNG